MERSTHGASRWWIGTGWQFRVRAIGELAGRRSGCTGEGGAKGLSAPPRRRVIGERRYHRLLYSRTKNVRSGANLAQALTSRKKLSPAGARDQLDLDANASDDGGGRAPQRRRRSSRFPPADSPRPHRGGVVC